MSGAVVHGHRKTGGWTGPRIGPLAALRRYARGQSAHLSRKEVGAALALIEQMVALDLRVMLPEEGNVPRQPCTRCGYWVPEPNGCACSEEGNRPPRKLKFAELFESVRESL